MRDASLSLVDSWEDAQQFVSWLGERRSILAIDTETTGLEYWTPNFLRLVQFGDTEGGWAIPAHRWLGLAEKALREYTGPVVMHNGKFDMHALESAGLPIPARHQVHDTMFLHAIANPLDAHGLKRIAVATYGPMAAAGEKEMKRQMAKYKWTWATIPYDNVAYWGYGVMDTVLTARLFEHMKGGASGEAYQRELDVARILYAAEGRGLRIDEDYTAKLAAEWAAEMAAIMDFLEDQGVKSALSRVQLLAALEAEIDFEPGEFTPTGEPKLTEGILAALPGEIAPKVLRYRRLRKWTSAYLMHFLHDRGPTGCVHPSINTIAARTGRMSVTAPALQTLPRGSTIRDCIIPRTSGNRLLAVDYDTQELRMFASYAGEEGLIQAFLAGKDLHTYAASLVYGVAEEEVTRPQRQITKNTQYALAYCAGAAKIALTAGVPEAEVRQFLDVYHGLFPDIDPFVKNVIKLAEGRSATDGHGWVKTLGGREVWCLPGEEYKLVNGLIQGGCADVIKMALVELDNVGLGGNIVLPVHDEVLFELDPRDEDEVRYLAEEAMTYRELRVPLTVHASDLLERWGDTGR